MPSGDPSFYLFFVFPLLFVAAIVYPILGTIVLSQTEKLLHRRVSDLSRAILDAPVVLIASVLLAKAFLIFVLVFVSGPVLVVWFAPLWRLKDGSTYIWVAGWALWSIVTSVGLCICLRKRLRLPIPHLAVNASVVSLYEITYHIGFWAIVHFAHGRVWS